MPKGLYRGTPDHRDFGSKSDKNIHKKRIMIITIDGPTASGKSTIARMLAEQQDIMYINSGLLYRAAAYVLKHNGTPVSHHKHLTQTEVDALFTSIHYTYTKEKGPIVRWHDTVITHLLKTAEIDLAASVVAVQPLVRQEILEYERKLAYQHDVVADGRDCGTVIFPHAEHKFFITGSLEIRAERWRRDQALAGKQFSLQESMKIVDERDRRDREREISPMVPADDALIIDTSHMTIQEVLIELITLVKQKERV